MVSLTTWNQAHVPSAFEFGVEFKSTIAQSGMPIIGVDVPPVVFDDMSKNASWVTDEDAWKNLATGFPTSHIPYAQQVRESVVRRKMDGVKFVVLFAVREERASLLQLF